jgi:hypothetical protein
MVGRRAAPAAAASPSSSPLFNFSTASATTCRLSAGTWRARSARFSTDAAVSRLVSLMRASSRGGCGVSTSRRAAGRDGRSSVRSTLPLLPTLRMFITVSVC